MWVQNILALDTTYKPHRFEAPLWLFLDSTSFGFKVPSKHFMTSLILQVRFSYWWRYVISDMINIISIKVCCFDVTILLLLSLFSCLPNPKVECFKNEIKNKFKYNFPLRLNKIHTKSFSKFFNLEELKKKMISFLNGLSCT